MNLKRPTFAFLIWILLGACFCLPCSVRSEDWEGKILSEIQSDEMEKEDRVALAASLGLEEGKSIHLARLDRALRELGDSGKWMRVFVEGVTEGGKLKVVLRGARVRKLRKMDFAGVDTKVLEEVRTRYRQEQDQNVDLESFAELRQAIKQGYEQQGYPFAQVQFNTQIVGPDEADVEVRVVPNDPTRVTRIQIRGAAAEDVKNLIDLIPLARGDVFSQKKLNEGISRIQAYLKANQYPTSRVEDTTLAYSKDSFEVEITLLVKLGERFQIQFIGNRIFDDVQMRALLTDEVLAQADPSLKIAALVEDKYRTVGYPHCDVTVKRTLVENGKLHLIELYIQEGERVRISDVRFTSGSRVGDLDLTQLFFEVAPGVLQRRLYWAEGISQAVSALQNHLLDQGYLHSRISEPEVTFSADRKSVVLFFDADIGVRTRVSRMEFEGGSSFSSEALQEETGVEPGDPLSRQKVKEGGERLILFYSNSGFPEAKFKRPPDQTIELSRDQQTAVVRYDIEEGTRFRVGAVTIEGLRKTKPKVILREMELSTGDTYSASKIRQSEENISLLGLFSRVEIMELPSPTESGIMDLRVVVRETRPGVGEVGLGGVYEEPRLRVRSFVGLAYRNVSGLNQTASFSGQVALPFSRNNNVLQIPFVEYATILGYRYPWALSLPFTFGAQVGLDRIEVIPAQQTLLTRARVEARLEKRFSSRLTGIYRLIRVERTTTQNYRPTDPANTNPLTESIGSTGPGIIVDLRDDIFNPTRGSFHSIDLELAHPLLFSQDRIAFLLGLSRNSFYVPLSSSFQLALSLGLGYAHSLNGQPIATARLVNELSLGGQGSIRGIAPRRLSPDLSSKDMAFYNARAEVSTKLFDDFGVAVFFDTGQIYPDFRPSARSDGVGVGLRYKTPVGPVVIDFAKGLGALAEEVKFYFTVGTI